MMKTCSLSVFLIGFALPTVWAQTVGSDSLTRLLKSRLPNDTAYVRAMDPVIIDLIYKKADYAKADSMSQQMIELASRLSDWQGVVRGYRAKSIGYLMTATYDQAVANGRKALEVAQQHHLPSAVIVALLSNLAASYDRMGDAPRVFKTALHAIQLQEYANIRPRSPVVYRLIGGALVHMGKAQQALPYYQQAGILFKELGDLRGIAIFENQLGELYNLLNQPQKAILHYQQALKLAQQLNFELLQFDIYDGLAQAMKLLNQPINGFGYAHHALKIAQKQQNKLAVCTVYATLASLYQAQKHYKSAEVYLTKALSLAEANKFKDNRKKLLQQLANLYGQAQNYKLAYSFQLQKNRQIDSAITIRTNAELQRLVAHYETRQKEDRIRLLQQQQQVLVRDKRLQQEEARQARWQRNTGLTGGFLILLLGGAVSGWLLNRSKLRQLEESLRLRQQLAHDLHDEVGSTLSSISLLSSYTHQLLRSNQSEPAQPLVQKIYADARQMLDAVDEIIWTLNPGNDSLLGMGLRLQEYAQPLMESKQIAFRVQFDADLEQWPLSMEMRRNLYLIGKEALTNLVKYSQAQQASLQIEGRGPQFVIRIEDDGQGFDPSLKNSRTGQSSMKQRAQAIGGRLVIHSSVGRGTLVELTAGTLTQQGVLKG